MNDEDLRSLESEFKSALSTVESSADVTTIRQLFLGKKSRLRQLLANVGNIPQSDRARLATTLNSLRENFDSTLRDLEYRLADRALRLRIEDEWTDTTLPGAPAQVGAMNPVTQAERRCLAILRRLGFELVEGPEVETELFNFDALNIPKHHPARDMQDTFFIQGGLVLRTHTTNVQARALSRRPRPPVRIVSRGRVYRNEDVDATHLAMFHQLEGVWLERGTTFAQLKWVLRFVAKELFGPATGVRFKPKYYPYTEPSVGMDIKCSVCRGSGCDACHGSGWVTIIGAGMIHSRVLETFHYNPEEVSGFAFGWGTSRLAAQLFGVSQVRRLYEQDRRFLQSLTD